MWYAQLNPSCMCKSVTHRSNDSVLQHVGKGGEALLFVDVDCDSLAQHQFHGGRVTQSHHCLHHHVHPLISRRHTVQAG